MFINNEFEIIASSLPEFRQNYAEKEIEEHILKETAYHKTVLNGQTFSRYVFPFFMMVRNTALISYLVGKGIGIRSQAYDPEGVNVYCSYNHSWYYSLRLQENKANIKITL